MSSTARICSAAVLRDRHDRVPEPAKSHLQGTRNRTLIFDYEDLLACHLITRRFAALSDARSRASAADPATAYHLNTILEIARGT